MLFLIFLQVYHALPLFIEAGKHAPKTVHLVTNPDWIKSTYVCERRDRGEGREKEVEEEEMLTLVLE